MSILLFRIINQQCRSINLAFKSQLFLPNLKKQNTRAMTLKLTTWTFFLFIIGTSTLAQKKVIELKLEEGHEYVFERIDETYGLSDNNSKYVFSVSEKSVRLNVEKFVSGEKAIVSLSFLKNSYDTPIESDKINRVDYFFPDYSAVNLQRGSRGLFNMYLCRSGIKFLLDLNTRKVKIQNRVELLEGFFEFLKLQGIEGKEREGIINIVSSKLINEQDYLVEHLLWFHKSEIDNDSTLNNSLMEDKLKVNKKGAQFLAFSDIDFNSLIPGKTYKKYWVETDNGIVSEYITIRRDSLPQNYYSFNRSNKIDWQVFETHFKLLYSKPVAERKLVVSGSIEKPLSNIIHIKTLNDSFGTIMKDRTIMLDENGYFETKIDFCNGGFVFVENENMNKHQGSKMFVFYAESGDTIGFIAKGEEMPWDISFSGTRGAESELMAEVGKKIDFRQDPGFMYRYLLHDELNGKNELLATYDNIKKIERLISAYKTTIDERALTFILNEVKSYIYTGFYNYFSSARITGVRIVAQDADGNLMAISDDATIKDRELRELENRIDKVNIQDTYNDYGVYSRRMVESFCAYQFNKIRRVNNNRTAGFGVDYSRDLESRIQFMRLMLSGSALYREIANVLASVIVVDQRVYMRNGVDDYWINYAIENAELFNKRCNDLSLVSSMESIIGQHQRLESDNFFPEISFLDLSGKRVTIDDLPKGKPTVICISEGFGHNRYLFDDYAQKNQEIDFVMVCENTSFDWWKEYTSRAEPVAKQLLFVSDSASIRETFQKPYVYVVLDKNGEMAGYANETEKAIKKARATLEPQKKQLNKSQLWLIILLLVITLTVIILSWIVWKWRVRQKFRKEQRQRRLRELELTAIRSQMNPHFLFNSLNSVQNLVQQNKGREAHLYLSDFAGLIRKVLNNSEKEEVSLAEELEMINQYLNLEKLRFDFEYTISVHHEVDTHNTMVPSMLMQPFAENAIIHGLQNKERDRTLRLEIIKEESGVKICIEDNGIGRTAAREISREKNGKGTKLVKERLEILQQKNKEKYELKVIDLGDHSGTRVEILIPEEL